MFPINMNHDVLAFIGSLYQNDTFEELFSIRQS